MTCEHMPTPLADAAAKDAVILADAPPDGTLPGDAAPDAPPPSTPMLVQQAGNSANPATTVSATLPAAPTNGRVLVMVGAAQSGALTSVTGGGATWTRATQSLDNTNIEIWWGVTDGSSAVVTVSRTIESSPIWLHVSEWTNLETAGTLDRATSTSGLSSPASSGSITTANARDLIIFGATAQAPNTFGTPSQGPWTMLNGVVGQLDVQGEWYRVVTATGTFAPAVTYNGAGDWEAGIAAFRIVP